MLFPVKLHVCALSMSSSISMRREPEIVSEYREKASRSNPFYFPVKPSFLYAVSLLRTSPRTAAQVFPDEEVFLSDIFVEP